MWCAACTCSFAFFILGCTPSPVSPGKFLARQTCVLRGVVPMLAAPMSEGSGDFVPRCLCPASAPPGWPSCVQGCTLVMPSPAALCVPDGPAHCVAACQPWAALADVCWGDPTCAYDHTHKHTHAATRAHTPATPPPLTHTHTHLPPADDLLNEAVHAAAAQRLVRPNDFVVCLKSVRGNMMVKVVQVRVRACVCACVCVCACACVCVRAAAARRQQGGAAA